MLFKIYFTNFNRIVSYITHIDDWKKKKPITDNYFIKDENLSLTLYVCVRASVRAFARSRVCVCACVPACVCVCVCGGGGVSFCNFKWLGSDEQCPRWRHHHAPRTSHLESAWGAAQARKEMVIADAVTKGIHPRRFILCLLNTCTNSVLKYCPPRSEDFETVDRPWGAAAELPGPGVAYQCGQEEKRNLWCPRPAAVWAATR